MGTDLRNFHPKAEVDALKARVTELEGVVLELYGMFRTATWLVAFGVVLGALNWIVKRWFLP